MTRPEFGTTMERGFGYWNRTLSKQFLEEWWEEFKSCPSVLFEDAIRRWNDYNRRAPTKADIRERVAAIKKSNPARVDNPVDDQQDEAARAVSEAAFPVFMQYVNGEIGIEDWVFELRSIATRLGCVNDIDWQSFGGVGGFEVPPEWGTGRTDREQFVRRAGEVGPDGAV